MALSPITREEAAKRLAELPESPHSIEALSDFVRAEVHARRHAPRAATISRVARLLAPAVSLQEHLLGEACSALERESDVILTPGGILFATPTRVVVLTKSARIFSSVPTRALETSLQREIDAKGAKRSVASIDGLTDAVMALGGTTITPETWAGFDRTPPADAAFLVKLEQRLEWRAQSAGSLEKDGTLEWRSWQSTPEGIRWTRISDGRLWRARACFGGHHCAWTAGGSPATSPFVELSPDDAARARFALARKIADASVLRVEHVDDRVIIEVPQWLPPPEFRWLSLRATLVSRATGLLWEISADDEGLITQLLSERLGISCIDKNIGALTGAQTTRASPKVGGAGEGAPPSLDIQLDDRVPDERAIGPLLRTLRVSTYRDLLRVKLDHVQTMRGVGKQKIKILERLIEEAQRRASPTTLHSTSHDGISDEGAPPRPTPRFNYDAWRPATIFRRLPKRISTIIHNNGLNTVAELKAWHHKADCHSVDNYGRTTHALLGRLLTMLEEKGHETLVFGGTLPTSVAHFAQRFLDQMGPTERNIFELRYPNGWTLDQIGQNKKLSRERIRQIVDRELTEAMQSWGARARELLDPAVRILEVRGGVALTATVLDSLDAPPLWALKLSAHIGGIEMLTDAIPSISTILPKEEFDEIQRDLRQELSTTRTPLLAGAVRGAMARAGLSFPESELSAVSDAMLGITIDGDDAYPNRRSVQYVFLKALRDAGRPLSAEEVALRVNELDPSIAATKRTAVSHFKRAAHVFSHSHGYWVHEDHLPVPRKELDELVAHCLPDIEEADGRAVNVRLLLSKLVYKGATEVTPHVLRDALIATGKVRGWRSGTDVAWLGGNIVRKPISEWIAEVAPDLEQPFDAAELADAVSLASGYLQTSVLTQMNEPRASVVPIGRSQYISTRTLWSQESDFAAVLSHVKQAVLSVGILSAEASTLRVPGLEHAIARFGTGVIWGLASRIPNDILTRESGWFAWSLAEGATLWASLENRFAVYHPLFRSATLREYLFTIGLTAEHVVSNLIAEWVRDGHLLRVGAGWYLDDRLSLERQIDLLNAQMETREMALGSQDLVRESPLRKALNEVRFRNGIFRVPPP